MMHKTSTHSLSELKLGFSPCPNDTFIFDALVNKKIDTGGITVEYVMEDVETLNQWALEGKLAITKLSYNTILHTTKQYTLLDSGSALGYGVGPLLIRKAAWAGDDTSLHHYLKTASIAIPGKNTTANLLFSLAFPEARNKTEVLFSEIEEKVLDGSFDCGLVIHESRFTYKQRGLHQLMDMGAWWEQKSGAAIPLGGICIKRDIDPELARQIDALIKESLRYSWQHYPTLSPFVTRNAQEMNEDVMRQHIELYVNKYSLSLGEEGKKAIDILFTEAYRNALIDEIPDNLYL